MTHLAKLSLFGNIVLNDQQQEKYTIMTAAWFLSPGKWHLNTTQWYRWFWQIGRCTYFIPWFD